MPSALSGRFFDGPKGRHDRPNLVIVEGPDDALFFDALLNDLGANPSDVGIIYLKGKDNLKENINQLNKSPSVESGRVKRIIISQDSDDDGAATEQRIGTILSEAGFPAAKHGTWAQSATGISIGLFLLPAVDTAGELETLCFSLINDSPKAQRVAEFFSEIERDFGALPKRMKRLCQIYLACTDTEARGVGMATASGLFPIHHPFLEPLRSYLADALMQQR